MTALFFASSATSVSIKAAGIVAEPLLRLTRGRRVLRRHLEVLASAERSPGHARVLRRDGLPSHG
jgi:hypothetical protein